MESGLSQEAGIVVKRLIDCNTSEIKTYGKREKLEAIAASEGRVLVSEVIGKLQPMLMSTSNAELAAAFGADILLLNMLDVHNPVFNGLPDGTGDEVVREIKKHTGRLVGINLEPVDPNAETIGAIEAISEGRRATAKTALKAVEMGVDLIVLTGNPGTGVSNTAITESLRNIREVVGDEVILIAGKMHAAGSLKEAGENLIKISDIDAFVVAGADVILLPAPGTVPGITTEYIRECVMHIHEMERLALTAIGTSQEGADAQTIRQIALMCKMTGTDMHHIGDAGFPGIALPENIMDYSIAIKGKRHTYNRMARSIRR